MVDEAKSADSQEPDRNAPRSTRKQVEQAAAPLSEEQKAALEARNGLLQFDAMVEKIRAGLREGANYRLRPSDILALHRVATLGLQDDAGHFRSGPVEIDGTTHEPPPAEDIPRLVEDLCDAVRQRWATAKAVHLAAYVMWRLNWIHPFSDGNGRTTRVVSYLVMCVHVGYEIPGSKAIPHLIAENKFPYYDALDAADAAAKRGEEDVSKMEELLSAHLAAQLLGVVKAATGLDPNAIYADDEEADEKPT